MSASEPLKVCFVGLKCYDLIARAATPRYMGGAERQQVLLARALARRGVSVSFVTLDQGQPDGIVHEGIRVFSAYRNETGMPMLRFFHPRGTGIARATRRAKADVYHQMAAGSETGMVAFSCRWRHRPRPAFVYAIASDSDCDPVLPLCSSIADRVLYRYGLRDADRIISQTERQHSLLRAGFGRESDVIPMLCAYEGLDAGAITRVQNKFRVVWIGRIDPNKRLEWLLEIAARLPDVLFEVVGAANEEASYTRTVMERARSCSNVIVHGRLPEEEMPKVYSRASCLCCTSILEGFPNTFLEAWSHGIPVVTTFDPDGIIAREALGSVVDSVEAGIDSLRRLSRSENEWDAVSTRCRSYFEKNFALDAILDRYEKLFREASAGVSQPL